MNEFLEQLLDDGPVVTDGAWGTELQARGLQPGECPDAWNLTQPDRVTEVANAYVKAGSQVILTNTFGATRTRLTEHGLGDRTAEINRQGVELSRQAAGDRAKVFASMGPTGKMLLTEETSEEELREVFAEQAQALAEARPDAIVIETMSDLAEARLALIAAKATGLPVVCCMVFDSGKESDRTMMGVTPEQASKELSAAGADAIGANCGVGIEKFPPVCERLRAGTTLPIWIKANAGLPSVEGDRVVYHTTPARYADHVPALVKAGASFIGGCCGTDPGFIRALKARIERSRGGEIA